MADSLSSWLALREPADMAARSETVTRAVVRVLADHDVVHALDLCTGTGSNIRYLAGHLTAHQGWLSVDRDASLLRQVPDRMSLWASSQGYATQPEGGGILVHGQGFTCDVRTRRLDLGALDDKDIFEGRQLVTASALLDLVSERWLRQLASRCHGARAAVLFGLTYNGHSECSPVEPEDGMVRLLMNRHQKRDKGLGGPAEGPAAVECAVRCFADLGYEIERDRSDWVLGAGDLECQRVLVEGWAEAANEESPDQVRTIAAWLGRRLQHVRDGRSRIIVGHDDVGAWLPR